MFGSKCETYEFQHAGDYHNLPLLTNNEASEYCFARYEDLNISVYTVGTSKDLIPPYIPTDQNSHETFIIKAGLVLFHGTVHSQDAEFDYPERGSFFATTPAHSLALVCLEKGYLITLQSQRFHTLNEMDFKPFGDDFKRRVYREVGELTGEKMRERVTELLSELRPFRGRLLTYILKKDIVVRDALGDSLTLKECLNLDCDGVLGGYNPSGEALSNLNELRLCGGPIEEYLQLIEERIISPEELQHQVFIDFFDIHQYLVHNRMFNVNSIICPTVRGWSVITDPMSIMHLYFKLRNKHAKDIDLALLTFMMVEGSNIYVYRDFENIVVLDKTKIKIWTASDSLRTVWEFVETILDYYGKLSDGLYTNGLKVKLANHIKISFYDDMGSRFREAGFPIARYM